MHPRSATHPSSKIAEMGIDGDHRSNTSAHRTQHQPVVHAPPEDPQRRALVAQLQGAGFTGGLNTQAELDSALRFAIEQPELRTRPRENGNAVVALLGLGTYVAACEDRKLARVLRLTESITGITPLVSEDYDVSEDDGGSEHEDGSKDSDRTTAVNMISPDHLFRAENQWLLQMLVSSLVATPGAGLADARQAHTEMRLKVARAVFEAAGKRGLIETMRALLKIPGIDVRECASELLSAAAYSGNVDMVRFLLSIPGIKISEGLEYESTRTR